MRVRPSVAFGAGALVATVFVLLALASFGPPWPGVRTAEALPKSYSPYRKLKQFARVLTYVENNYVHHVDQKRLIHGAISGMLAELDPHSLFMPPDQYRQMRADTQGEFGGLGIEVEMRDKWLTVVAPIEGTPADRAGIQSGDRIVKIDGKTTRGMRMDQAVRALRGARGTRVKLGLRRGKSDKKIEIEVVRDLIKIVSVTAKLLEPGVGYLRIKNFQDRTAAYLHQELRKLREKGTLRGLILDLRNNPGGLLEQAIRVADAFIDGGLIVKTTGKGGRVLDREMAHEGGTIRDLPIVCLVNGGSASASEIVAGALQDHKRAVVLGTPTFGKGSVQTIIELGDGSGLKLTVARYYTPSGRSIQERGIEPDIIVQKVAPPAEREQTKREKDLKRHLPNGKAAASSQRKRLADFQLQTALDYLRAAQIFSTRAAS